VVAADSAVLEAEDAIHPTARWFYRSITDWLCPTVEYS